MTSLLSFIYCLPSSLPHSSYFALPFLPSISFIWALLVFGRFSPVTSPPLWLPSFPNEAFHCQPPSSFPKKYRIWLPNRLNSVVRGGIRCWAFSCSPQRGTVAPTIPKFASTEREWGHTCPLLFSRPGRVGCWPRTDVFQCTVHRRGTPSPIHQSSRCMVFPRTFRERGSRASPRQCLRSLPS